MELRNIEVVGGGPAGLFAARLIKDRLPRAHVRVSERTVPDETFGFGVAFTARTLRAVAEADRRTFDRLLAAGVDMPAQEFRVGPASARAAGTGGAIGVARSRLLAVLLDEALAAGVQVEVGRERELADVAGADLVVAADGAGSRIRTALREEFGGTIEPGRGVFLWLGCDVRISSNLFAPVFTEHGMFTIHGYPYAQDRSTLGVEADVETWRRAGMEVSTIATPAAESDEYSLGYLQKAFDPVLGGAKLLANRSRWMHFRVVSIPRWHHGNVVLIGDSAHTAHYSVGSGTKMAMEDAIALANALADPAAEDLSTALAAYEAARRPPVEALQDTAIRSQRWWDSLRHRVALPPAQLLLGYLSRGGVVSARRLAEDDPHLLAEGLAAFAGEQPPAAALKDPVGWTLARPYRTTAVRSRNRLVDHAFAGIAPGLVREAQADRAGGAEGYLALSDNVHEIATARTLRPNSLLIATMAVQIDDPWGARADALVECCRLLAEAGADGVRFDSALGTTSPRPADPGAIRRDLLDRLALAERLTRHAVLATVVGGPAAHADDLADAILAGRVDLVAIIPDSAD
ncbi:MAG TPA: FAD-dependent monooxygenase [Actinocrinis sp.]|nr:FAD-dependent monooxygenase [Actinocrinis sp.]